MMMKIKAPAKINLSFQIIGKRADGYHEVLTRMQKVSLTDTLFLERTKSGGLAFTCDDLQLQTEAESNLVVRAAETFLNNTKGLSGEGLRITLQKRIPVAAGLGGGSSDAGAVLQGLNRIFNYPYTMQELVELSRPLGADVPFFTSDYTAVMASGIGDVLEPCDDLAGFWIVLVNPGIGVSTRWVFEKYALTRSLKNFKVTGFQNKDNRDFSSSEMCNDLESVTIEHFPVIGDIKTKLLDLGAEAAMMTGSGPTVFGIFRETGVAPGKKAVILDDLSSEFGSKVFSVENWTGA